jgi:hypothetical protein
VFFSSHHRLRPVLLSSHCYLLPRLRANKSNLARGLDMGNSITVDTITITLGFADHFLASA